MIHVGDFLATYLKNNRVHTKSLVSTVFGDLLVPNGNQTWIKTLSEIFEPLGINDRLVRTTLYRLVEDNWVYATKKGRRSFYSLTDSALSKTLLAEKLIYTKVVPDWDGEWTLVFLVKTGLPNAKKRDFIQELKWIGFGTVASNVLAYPGDILDLVSERSLEMQLGKEIIVMKCKNIHNQAMGFANDDRDLAINCMPYTDVETKYNTFINNFSGLIDPFEKVSIKGSKKELLSLRILMIDEYRRIILKDNHLPIDLLPEPWSGTNAYNICSQIYKHIQNSTNKYYLTLQNSDPIHDDRTGSTDFSAKKLPKRFKT